MSTYYSSRICGFICPGSTDTYTFQLVADDGAILYINDTMICNAIYTSNPAPTDTIALTAGQWYPIMIEMTQGNNFELSLIHI